jgi:hypothetical protein
MWYYYSFIIIVFGRIMLIKQKTNFTWKQRKYCLLQNPCLFLYILCNFALRKFADVPYKKERRAAGCQSLQYPKYQSPDTCVIAKNSLNNELHWAEEEASTCSAGQEIPWLLPYSRGHATDPYPVPEGPSTHSSALFLYDLFLAYFPYFETNKSRLMRSRCCLCVCLCIPLIVAR